MQILSGAHHHTSTGMGSFNLKFTLRLSSWNSERLDPSKSAKLLREAWGKTKKTKTKSTLFFHYSLQSSWSFFRQSVWVTSFSCRSFWRPINTSTGLNRYASKTLVDFKHFYIKEHENWIIEGRILLQSLTYRFSLWKEMRICIRGKKRKTILKFFLRVYVSYSKNSNIAWLEPAQLFST